MKLFLVLLGLSLALLTGACSPVLFSCDNSTDGYEAELKTTTYLDSEEMERLSTFCQQE